MKKSESDFKGARSELHDFVKGEIAASLCIERKDVVITWSRLFRHTNPECFSAAVIEFAYPKLRDDALKVLNRSVWNGSRLVARPYNFDNHNMHKASIRIPQDLAGPLIGSGGENIQNIEKASDVSIRVSLPDQYRMRTAWVLGESSESVRHGERLVREFLQTMAAGNNEKDGSGNANENGYYHWSTSASAASPTNNKDGSINMNINDDYYGPASFASYAADDPSNFENTSKNGASATTAAAAPAPAIDRAMEERTSGSSHMNENLSSDNNQQITSSSQNKSNSRIIIDLTEDDNDEDRGTGRGDKIKEEETTHKVSQLDDEIQRLKQQIAETKSKNSTQIESLRTTVSEWKGKLEETNEKCNKATESLYSSSAVVTQEKRELRDKIENEKKRIRQLERTIQKIQDKKN